MKSEAKTGRIEEIVIEERQERQNTAKMNVDMQRS